MDAEKVSSAPIADVEQESLEPLERETEQAPVAQTTLSRPPTIVSSPNYPIRKPSPYHDKPKFSVSLFSIRLVPTREIAALATDAERQNVENVTSICVQR